MKLANHLRTLLIIAILAGILGGMGNYFILNLEFTLRGLIRSILLGIIAAGVLPLFLKLVASRILDYDKNEILYKNYISFVSLCLLASLFADTFLQGIYSKVFEQVSEQVSEASIRAEDSNKKVDYLLNSIILEQNKSDTVLSRAKKEELIENLMKTHLLEKTEAEILFEIKRTYGASTAQLYKLFDKKKVDKTLRELLKKELINKINRTSQPIFIPRVNLKYE